MSALEDLTVVPVPGWVHPPRPPNPDRLSDPELHHLLGSALDLDVAPSLAAVATVDAGTYATGCDAIIGRLVQQTVTYGIGPTCRNCGYVSAGEWHYDPDGVNRKYRCRGVLEPLAHRLVIHLLAAGTVSRSAEWLLDEIRRQYQQVPRLQRISWSLRSVGGILTELARLRPAAHILGEEAPRSDALVCQPDGDTWLLTDTGLALHRLDPLAGTIR